MSSTAPSHLPDATSSGWTRTLLVSLGAATIAAAATYAVTQEDLPAISPAPVVADDVAPLHERLPGEADVLTPSSRGAGSGTAVEPSSTSTGRQGGPIAGW